MKKTEEYRQHAQECRQLANRADAASREMLLNMAETWEALAVNRERQIAREERIRALEIGRESERQ